MARGRSLVSYFGANTSGFTAGIKKMRDEIKKYNDDLAQNKKAQAEVNKEIKEAQKELKTIGRDIKAAGQATEDQKKRQDELNKIVTAGKQRLADLKDEQDALKFKIADCNKKIDEQKKALSTLKKSITDAKSAGKELSKEILAIGAAYAAAVAGILKYTSSAAKWADDLETLSDQTGISASELQKFMYASELVDVDVQTLTGSLTRLTQAMAQAQKNPKSNAAGVFEALNVDTTDKLTGQLRDRQTVFYELLDALKKVGSETERDSMLLTLFGKSAEQLNPLIKGGADTIRQLGSEAEAAGLIIDDLTIKRLHGFNDKIDLLKAKGEQIKNITAAQMIPAAEGLLEVADDLLNRLNEMAKTGELEQRAKEIGAFIKTTAEGLRNLISWLWKNKEAVVGFTAAMVTFKVSLTVVSLISSVTLALKSLKKADDAATAAQIALNTAMGANPYAATLSLILALVGGITAYSIASSSAASSTEELTRAAHDYLTTLRDAQSAAAENAARTEADVSTIQTLADEYESLRVKQALTAEEKERLRIISEDLAKTLGISIDELKDKSGAYKSLAGNIDEYIEKLREQTRFENTKNELTAAYTSYDSTVAAAEKQLESLKEAKDKVDKAISEYDKDSSEVNLKVVLTAQDEFDRELNQWQLYTFQVVEASDAIAKYEASLKSFSDEEERSEWIKNRSAELINKVTGGWSEAAGKADEATEANEDFADSLKNCSEQIDKAFEEQESLKKSLEAFSKTASSAKGDINELAQAQQKLSQGQALDLNTIISLIDKYPDYAAQLIAARGNVDLQREAIKKLFEAKKAEYILTQESAASELESSNKETEAVLDNIRKKIDSYMQLAKVMKGLGLISDRVYSAIETAVIFNLDKTEGARYAELKKNLVENQKLIEAYRAKAKLVGSMSIEDFTSGSSSSSEKTGSKTTDTQDENIVHVWGRGIDVYGKTVAETYQKWLDRVKALGKLSVQDEIRELENLKNNYQLNADEKYEIDVRLYQARQKLAQEQETQRKQQLDLVRAAYEKLINDRIALYQKQSDAAKAAADKEIAALDELKKKRSEENEDAKRSAELAKINARLRYGHIEEIERLELERKRQDLINEQANINFERDVESRKAQIQSRAEAVADKNSIAIEGLNTLVAKLDMFLARQTGTLTNQQIVNNNNQKQNFNIVANNIDNAQLMREIRNAVYT